MALVLALRTPAPGRPDLGRRGPALPPFEVVVAVSLSGVLISAAVAGVSQPWGVLAHL